MSDNSNKKDMIDIHFTTPYSGNLYNFFERPGMVFLIHYKVDDEDKFALHHEHANIVFIYDSNFDNNHNSMTTKEFCDEFKIINIFKCRAPFVLSAVICIVFKALKNRDYYDILMRSFLHQDYNIYTLEDLIKTQSNLWFERLEV